MKTQRHTPPWSPETVYRCAHSSRYLLQDCGITREFCMSCGTALKLHAVPQRSLTERIGSQIENWRRRLARTPKLSRVQRAHLLSARTGISVADAYAALEEAD